MKVGSHFKRSQRPVSYARGPPLLGGPLVLQPKSCITALLLSVLHCWVHLDLFHQMEIAKSKSEHP